MLLTGIMVIAGWSLALPALAQPMPWLPAMVPNTAVSLVLLSTALLLVRRGDGSATRRTVAAVSAATVVVLATITIVESLGHWHTGVDPVFSRGSAAALVMLGSALLVLDAKPARRADLSEVLAVGATLVALLTIAGYLYGATDLYQSAKSGTGMAPHTAAAILVLSASILCARPDRPLIALVASMRAGGFAVRRLLLGGPAILALGFLVTLGLRRSLYGEPFAAALLAVAAMTIAIVLVLSTGRALDRVDALRTESERALAEREVRLRDLIDKASDGIFIADLDGRYMEVNDAVCRMVGYSREEMLGKTIMDLLPDDEIPRLKTSKADLLHGGSQVDEWRLHRSDGTFVPVEVSTKILPDGRWQGLVRDISLRKELEHAGEAVFEALGAAPLTSVRTVLQTIATEVQSVANAEYVALGLNGSDSRPFDPGVFVGLPPEQASLIGRVPRAVSLLGIVAAENRTVRVANVREHPGFLGVPPYHPQITSFLGVPIRRDGRWIGNLYLANKRGGSEFSAADERVVERIAAQAGTAIETARLYQAEGLRRAWLQAVIDQMPEGVILLDATGTIRVESRSIQAYARATGQRDQFGQAIKYELFTPDGDRVPLDDQPQIRAIRSGLTTMRHELLLQRQTGGLVPMLVSAAPVFDTEGKQSGAVAIFQDISAQKDLERLRKEWASVVAHDLRQPLGVIVLDADALTDMPDAAQAPEYQRAIERIRRSARQMNKMIDDLADVSLIEARRLKLDCAETDLARLLEDAVDRLSRLAGGHPVRLSKTIDSAPAIVDAARIEQVLGNLITNAAKYGEPGGEIGVRLSRSGDDSEVAVVNRGRGIPAADLPKLFERFSRREASRQSGVPGLGLGLYISKGLVEAHGGRIRAESVIDGVTTFVFTLPRVLVPPFSHPQRELQTSTAAF